ncbi:unnamed protein product, partial [Ectocarpus fasciculatus]
APAATTAALVEEALLLDEDGVFLRVSRAVRLEAPAAALPRREDYRRRGSRPRSSGSSNNRRRRRRRRKRCRGSSRAARYRSRRRSSLAFSSWFFAVRGNFLQVGGSGVGGGLWHGCVVVAATVVRYHGHLGDSRSSDSRSSDSRSSAVGIVTTTTIT